jgi:hypothetical protein
MAAMGNPAPHRDATDAPPAPDPRAVEHAYRLEKAKRHVRLARARERRAAHIRFFVVVVVLVALSLAFGLTAWREIQRVFGL